METSRHYQPRICTTGQGWEEEPERRGSPKMLEGTTLGEKRPSSLSRKPRLWPSKEERISAPQKASKGEPLMSSPSSVLG